MDIVLTILSQGKYTLGSFYDFLLTDYTNKGMKKVRKLKHTVLALILYLSASASAHAGAVMDMGLHFGGDNLLTIITGTGSDTIRAGQLFSFAGGATFDITSDLEGMVTIGYYADSQTYSNGSADFSRIPINGMVFYEQGTLRLGGGLTYHLNPTLTCDITAVCNSTATADSALGYMLEAGSTTKGGRKGRLYYGLRYTIINYQFAGGSVDGSNFALVFSLLFDK